MSTVVLYCVCHSDCASPCTPGQLILHRTEYIPFWKRILLKECSQPVLYHELWPQTHTRHTWIACQPEPAVPCLLQRIVTMDGTYVTVLLKGQLTVSKRKHPYSSCQRRQLLFKAWQILTSFFVMLMVSWWTLIKYPTLYNFLFDYHFPTKLYKFWSIFHFFYDSYRNQAVVHMCVGQMKNHIGKQCSSAHTIVNMVEKITHRNCRDYQPKGMLFC